MRRRSPAIASVLAVLALGGCSYATPAKLTAAQQQARIAFLKSHTKFNDRELAQLCPGLYPATFLTDTKKYPEAKLDKKRKAPTVTATDRAQAAAAGCDIRRDA
jgi:hypothetical protein